MIPEKAGWDTPLFSQLLGIVLMVATVMVVLRMARICSPLRASPCWWASLWWRT
ncbi:MAG: hypothetical protein R2789_14135 [Microthrixaceae bacterium]